MSESITITTAQLRDLLAAVGVAVTDNAAARLPVPTVRAWRRRRGLWRCGGGQGSPDRSADRRRPLRKGTGHHRHRPGFRSGARRAGGAGRSGRIRFLAGCTARRAAAGLHDRSVSLAADLARWQRRIRPEKRRTPLGYRDRSALPFFPAVSLAGPVMLDTCAYIDALSGKMPLALQALLPGRRHLHSTVCLAELAFGLGAIKPGAPHAARSRSTLGDLLDRIEIRRTVSLPASGWMAAGLIAGVLARLQGGGRAERRRFLADAAIYLCARTAGTPRCSRRTGAIST